MRALLTACLFLILSCASTYESDKSDPNYQHGPYTPGGITASGPEAAGEATVGAVASGIALALNRDYYKTKALTGQCLCRASEDSPIELPCPALDVVISDAKGKELSRVQTQNGEFAFRVQPKVTYRLRIEAARYRVTAPAPGNLALGDDVILHLVREKGTTE